MSLKCIQTDRDKLVILSNNSLHTLWKDIQAGRFTGSGKNSNGNKVRRVRLEVGWGHSCIMFYLFYNLLHERKYGVSAFTETFVSINPGYDKHSHLIALLECAAGNTFASQALNSLKGSVIRYSKMEVYVPTVGVCLYFVNTLGEDRGLLISKRPRLK